MINDWKVYCMSSYISNQIQCLSIFSDFLEGKKGDVNTESNSKIRYQSVSSQPKSFIA